MVTAATVKPDPRIFLTRSRRALRAQVFGIPSSVIYSTGWSGVLA